VKAGFDAGIGSVGASGSEIAAGDQAALASACNEFIMQTYLTNYCEYTTSDLATYHNAVANSGHSMVAGVGFWYYITLPYIRVYPEVNVGSCGVALDSWFDSIRDKSFVSIANDNVKAKQSAADASSEAAFRHPLTSSDVPFLLRDTFVAAAGFGTSNSACSSSRMYLMGSKPSPEPDCSSSAAALSRKAALNRTAVA